MSICSFCQKDSFYDGYCDHCGRVVAQCQVALIRPAKGSLLSRGKGNLTLFNLTVTDRYLIFTKGTDVIKTSIAAGGLGAIGVDIAEARKEKENARHRGMLDLKAVKSAVAYFPKSVLNAPAIFFNFANGTNLFLGIGENFGKKNTNALITALTNVGITPTAVECKKLDTNLMNHPIAELNELTYTVSSSAAAFLEPFEGMRVVEI